MSARTRGAAPERSMRPVPAAAVRQRWLVPAVLMLLCAGVYANSFTTGFALDSRQLILNDPRVHAFTNENLSLILRHSYWWPYGESGLYRPLTTLSYLFDYSLLGHGTAPAGYHVLNLVLHIANVLLLWRIATRVTADAWVAAAAAALWAVLPLSTEAVTNIVGRADLLAATGGLAAVLLMLRIRDEGRRSNVLAAVAMAAAVTLGTLAKESAVAVLGVLVAGELLWWTPPRSPKRLALLAVCCALPLTLWFLQRGAVLGASPAAEFPFADNPIVGAGFWQGRLTALQAMWRYLALIAWPAHLSSDYSFPQVPLATPNVAGWAGSLLLVAGATAALWQARANRALLFFAAFAFVTFLPASNLLFATGTIMGERLVYLPSAGLMVLIAIGLRRLGTTPVRLRVVTAVAAVLVTAYGARTIARNPDWTNDVTLWSSAVKAAPSSAKAHRALAEALYDRDPSRANIDAVIEHADWSVALLEALPDDRNTFQAYRQAGAYYLDKANLALAQPQGENDPEVRRLHSRALSLLDRAVMIAASGARSIPGASTEPEADAQRLRAAATLGLKNPSLALVAANKARGLNAMHPLGYRLAAEALLQMHRDEEAVMLLLTGSIVTSDRGLGQEAMTLYAGGVDLEGCAVTGSGASAALNPQCATVVRHSCIASAAAYQILNKAGQPGRATEVKDAALTGFGCPASLMVRANSLVP